MDVTASAPQPDAEIAAPETHAGHGARGAHGAPREREALLAAMTEFQRHMVSRMGGGTANEWLRLDLSIGQVKLLMWLVEVGEGPMSRLAQVLGIGLPAATSLVDKLVDAGLATREHSAADRRVVLVRASEAGAALVTRLRQISADRLRRVVDHVPDDALPTLISASRILAAAAHELAAAEQAEQGAGPASRMPHPRYQEGR
jgi:DNA-binding MarR family transcriptional regulator